MCKIPLSRGIASFLLCLSLLGCEKSVIGPDISGREVNTLDPGVNGSVSCQRTSGHNVYYFGSAISLSYECDSALLAAPLNVPSFLTHSLAGNSVSFVGLAPEATSTAMWSFAAGDATNILTKVISSESLVSSIPTSVDLDANNDTEISLSHTAELDASWDGSMDDVDLSVAGITTDMHGLTLFTSCSEATASYICNGDASRSDNTIVSNLNIRWSWGAFDQGDYYLDVTPELVIEGGSHSLPGNTAAFTIPMQSAGNVPISHASDSHNAGLYNDTRYSYSVAVSPTSTPSLPIVGAIYVANDSRHSSFFRRLGVDRTDDPASPASGITESTEIVVSNDNSSDFTVRALADGSWATLGAVTTAGAKQDLYFNRVSNSSSNPSSSLAVRLSDFDLSNNIAASIDMTQPFTDNTDGVTRIGFSFVRNHAGTNIRYLTVAKLNPNGTNLATVMDDPNYGVDTADFEIAGANNTVDMDRTRIRWIDESGKGYFYVAYRRDTDIMLTKLLSKYDAGHGANTITLASGELSDVGTNNQQSLDLALGSINGGTVAALVYRRPADGRCYFKRVDSTLASVGNALMISANACYFPTIHFNPASGRFIVTQAERNASNTYDIVKTEVTVGSGADDTKSSNVVVAQTGAASQPIKLVTDFYPAGNWIAILYRKLSTDILSFHGYHVSGR